VPVVAKLQELLTQLTAICYECPNDLKVNDSCSSLIYNFTSYYVNKSSVYVLNTFSHLTQTTYECE